MGIGKSQKAWELLSIPSIVRVGEAYRLSLEAVEYDPYSPDVWRALALSIGRSALAVASSENHIHTELMLRSLIAGQIASWIAPDDVKNQIVYWVILCWYGRTWEAMDLADKYLSKNPQDELAKAASSAFWGDKNKFPFSSQKLKNDGH